MSAFAWGRGDNQRVATRDFPRAVLALVDERQGGRFCVECRALNMVTPPDVPLEIDHRQALAAGGDNHHLNLVWRCRSHNRAKGARKEGAARVPRWARRRSR